MLGELQNMYELTRKAEKAFDAINGFDERLQKVEKEVSRLATLLEGFIKGRKKDDGEDHY